MEVDQQQEQEPMSCDQQTQTETTNQENQSTQTDNKEKQATNRPTAIVKPYDVKEDNTGYCTPAISYIIFAMFTSCTHVGGVLTKDENLCTIYMTNVQIAFDMMNMQIVEPSSTFTF